MNSLLLTYILSRLLGRMFAGALIGGLIPFIVAFVKGRFSTGIKIVLFCGIGTLLHPFASIIIGIMGILFIFTSINMASKENNVKSASYDKEDNQINFLQPEDSLETEPTNEYLKKKEVNGRGVGLLACLIICVSVGIFLHMRNQAELDRLEEFDFDMNGYSEDISVPDVGEVYNVDTDDGNEDKLEDNTTKVNSDDSDKNNDIVDTVDFG